MVSSYEGVAFERKRWLVASCTTVAFRRRVAAPHVDNIDSQTFLSFELFYGGMCAQEVSHA